MWRSYYSNGKLLITGEYAVLDGALALAVPTRLGQHLRVRENDTGYLRWTGLDENNNPWFEQLFYLEDFSPLEDQIEGDWKSETSARLTSILEQVRVLNPQFLSEAKGIEVETQTEFNRNWGLGTSSTLINNIAQWAKVDAFQLNKLTFGGSGYDIACAQSDGALLYQLEDGRAEVQKVSFDPPFSQNLFFIFLNQKMNSREAIKNYRRASFDKDQLLDSISGLTGKFLKCNQLEQFHMLINQHEQLIAEALGVPTVKNSLFPDYSGSVKSLGGWGGDFVLAAGDEEGPEYFKSLGYETVIPFKEMIL